MGTAIRSLHVHTIAALVTLLFAWSCGSSSQTSTAPTPARCALQVQSETSSFPAGGGSGTLRIVTNRECTWAARSEAGWLSVGTPAEGQGDGSVQFTVAGNGDPSPRGASINVNDQRMQISQEGRPCELRVSSSFEQFDASGGERTIQVTASSDSCTWTASSSDPWITVVAGAQGRGSAGAIFRVASLAGASRTGSLTVAGASVQVVQLATGAPPGPGPPPIPPGPGCTYALSTAGMNVSQSGGPSQVSVITPNGCGWAAQSNVAWMSIVGSPFGSGPGVVTFSVDATDGASRSGTLTIAEQTLTVVQAAGCTYTVDPTFHNAGNSGGSGSVTVQTAQGCAWSSASGASWITITDGASGNGPGKVAFTIAANSGTARQASLTVAGQTVAVTQTDGCAYGISPSSQSVGAGASSGTVSVTTSAGCPWSASSGASWITISSGSSGSGSGQVGYAVAANSGPARQGSLTIAGRTFTISQESGCSYNLSSSGASVPSTASSGSVSVTTSGGCAWAASSGAPWITITGGSSGSGPGQVGYSIAVNTGPARQSSLTIAGRSFSISQASGCTYSVSPTSGDFPAAGGTGAPTVTTAPGCPWNASGGSGGWITFPTPNNTGPGPAQFVVAPNAGEPRSDSVTIAGQPFTVRQASPCTFTLVPPFANYDRNGGTGAILVVVVGSCSWTATSAVEWVRITNGATGAGGGLVQFTVLPNSGGNRSGTLVIGGQTFTVNQSQ